MSIPVTNLLVSRLPHQVIEVHLYLVFFSSCNELLVQILRGWQLYCLCIYTMSWRCWGDVKVQRSHSGAFCITVCSLLLLMWRRQMQLEARSCKSSSLAQNFTNVVCFIFLPSIALELFYVQIDMLEWSSQGIPDWLESEEVQNWWERGDMKVTVCSWSQD